MPRVVVFFSSPLNGGRSPMVREVGFEPTLTNTLVSAVKEDIFIEGTYDTELFTKETMIEESVADNGTNNYVFGSDEEKSNISDDSEHKSLKLRTLYVP